MDSGAYEEIKDIPRPGHADWVALHKFGGFADMRGSGHFFGRLTASLVAAGVAAKKLLKPAVVTAKLLEVGGSQHIEKTVAEAIDGQDSVSGLIECHVSKPPAGLGEPFFDSVESMVSHAIFAIQLLMALSLVMAFRLVVPGVA